MSLVITRNLGSAFYAGRHLDPDSLETTFSAKVEVIGLSDAARSYADLRIVIQQFCPGKDGGSARTIEEVRLDVDSPEAEVDVSDLFDDGTIYVRLLAVERETRTPSCRVEARVAVTAPGDVSILRDNARRRAPRGQS